MSSLSGGYGWRERFSSLIVLLGCAILAMGVGIPAVADAEDDETKEKEERTLPPKVEKVFGEFVKKAEEERLKTIEDQVGELAEELEESYKLDPVAKDKLSDLQPKVIEETREIWTRQFREWLEPFLFNYDDPLDILQNQWKPEQMAANSGEVYARPDRTDAWNEGLGEVLTEVQFKKHNEKLARELEETKKEINAHFKIHSVNLEESFKSHIEMEIDRVVRLAKIDDTRQKRLQEEGKGAIDEVMARWRELAEEKMLNMADAQREQMLANGSVPSYRSNEKKNDPRETDTWKQALDNVLTAAERKTIEQKEKEYRKRRCDALARMLIQGADQYVGFSREQRVALLPIFQEAMDGLKGGHYFTAPASGYSSMNVGNLLAQTNSIKDEKILPLLDKKQKKRWNSLDTRMLSGSSLRTTANDVKGVEIPKPEDMTESEMDRILTLFTHRHARSIKKSSFLIMEAKMDNIARSSDLSEKEIARLRTASKGAAEQLSHHLLTNVESWVNSNFRNCKPEDLPSRIKNMGNRYFSRNRNIVVPSIWQSAVRQTLSPEQAKHWKKELLEAQKWAMETQVRAVMTDLEKRISLEEDKRKALSAKVEEMIRKYSQDFRQMFSHQWYMQGYYSATPIALIPEKELKEILDEKEVKVIRERCLGYALQYVGNIKQYYKNRTGKDADEEENEEKEDADEDDESDDADESDDLDKKSDEGDS